VVLHLRSNSRRVLVTGDNSRSHRNRKQSQNQSFRYSVREGNVFLLHKFSNTANWEVHEQSTGPEIWYQLRAQELKPDAFVA
jgi:cysteine synthase